MEDFIRPNHNQKLNKPPKKSRRIKETALIVGMIFCLAVGFIAGYVSKRSTTTVANSNNTKTIIEEAYSILNSNWLNPNDQDVDIKGNTITSLVESLGDIHSSYFTQEESASFNQTVDGNYEGIGVVQRTVSEGTMVIEVYQNSPAQKSGLQVGDIITAVDGTSVAGKSASDIAQLIRGTANTKVTLTIIRSSGNLDIEVERGNVDSSVASEIRDNNGKQFGYIKINTFGTTTAKDIEEALKTFTEVKIDTLVMDLRGNGGGYLTAATDVLSLFMKENQLLFKMESKNGAVEEYKAKDCTKYNFINGYILVDGETASASEVVAGTLQEKAGYKLVGQQTYGKGTAQTQKTLSDGSVLKYTYAKWLLPSGTWINGTGLTPDYNVSNIDISEISTKELDNDMGFDSVGNQIASMQKMLAILGYDCGRNDGYFSNQTRDALMQFEQANNLTIDGIYTNDERQKLEAAVIVYVKSENNDYQYKKLMELVK